MAEHLSTDDNIHSYSYGVDDLARAIALTLEYAYRHPGDISTIRSFKGRGEAIARTFDDAYDANESWDLDDIAHGLKRTCG